MAAGESPLMDAACLTITQVNTLADEFARMSDHAGEDWRAGINYAIGWLSSGRLCATPEVGEHFRALTSPFRATGQEEPRWLSNAPGTFGGRAIIDEVVIESHQSPVTMEIEWLCVLSGADVATFDSRDDAEAFAVRLSDFMGLAGS